MPTFAFHAHARRVAALAMTLAAVALAVALAPAAAHAHFYLRAPACFSEQDSLGLPEKSAPCGQADPGNPAVPTGAVTAYVEGGMLTVTITEEITHPGHYRVAIAPDMSSLPADPPVTAGSTPCGSTVIETDPTLPILADNLFPHTSAFSGDQTAQIPLPAGFTCDHCVLQVIEFMSDHALNNPGGCFYHHCAIVNVTAAADGGMGDGGFTPADGGSGDGGFTPADGGNAGDGGVMPADASAPGPDAGTSPPASSSGGCGCRVAAPSPSGTGAWLGVAFVGIVLFVRRRRRGGRGRRRTSHG